MRQQLEGSRAVAEAVGLCRPQVIAAYPITPQTHIIEHLAQMVADGDLTAEYINVESEFAAASLVLGAVAGGTRSFTASASQGLLLMTEVLYNIAGMRLPVVMVCANRAISSPINIFSDHQDSMAQRDSGWVQLYVESNQEAVDTLIQAYCIAEGCELPVMVCMDGFFLTHTFEPVDLPTQTAVDQFLPAFHFARTLDPKHPMTLGGGSEPENYLEFRASQHIALLQAQEVIKTTDANYAKHFGRSYGGLIDAYRIDGADTVLLGLGSMMGVVKDVVDTLREQGQAVGALRLRCFRPFPALDLVQQLVAVKRVVVLEKAFSAGGSGIVAIELRAAFYDAGLAIPVAGFIAGLGGRDVTPAVVEAALHRAMESHSAIDSDFLDCRLDRPTAFEI